MSITSRIDELPDIIVFDDRRLRCVTNKAAEWIANDRGIDMRKHRRSIIVLEKGDSLLVDAYMSGLTLRDRLGHYYHSPQPASLLEYMT